MAYLYHIKLPGMSLHEGYIGISKCYETRWKQHEHAAHNLMSPYVVHQNMRRYKGEYVKEVIAEGTVQEVLDQEHSLRPEPMMSWNMAPGGGLLPTSNLSDDDWVSHEIWHPIHGDRVVDLNKFTPMDACRLVGVTDVSSDMVRVLRGHRYEYKGWQLRDAQLARQVQTWLEAPWDLIYVKKDSNIHKIYHNGSGDFFRHLGREPGRGTHIKTLVKGTKKAIDGWSLATQEEYEANPGRVFGTPEEDDCETTTYTYTDGVTEELSTSVKEQEAEHGTSQTENTPCMSVGCDVTSTKGVWGSVKSWIGTLLSRKRWIERSI